MTETYQDYGGGVHDRWYGAISNDCPECGVKAGEQCWNALSQRPKHLPCIKRTKVTV